MITLDLITIQILRDFKVKLESSQNEIESNNLIEIDSTVENILKEFKIC
jgi:hypothetical protein